MWGSSGSAEGRTLALPPGRNVRARHLLEPFSLNLYHAKLAMAHYVAHCEPGPVSPASTWICTGDKSHRCHHSPGTYASLLQVREMALPYPPASPKGTAERPRVAAPRRNTPLDGDQAPFLAAISHLRSGVDLHPRLYRTPTGSGSIISTTLFLAVPV